MPSSASNICTRTPNTLPFFSPHLLPTSIPYPTPQYSGWVPANDTKGHNCEWQYFFMGSDAQCTTTIEQHDVGDESNSSFLGQTNLYSIISCNIQGLNTKKQKHKVQLISELANNENTFTITLTEMHLNEKILDSDVHANEELHWISCIANRW